MRNSHEDLRLVRFGLNVKSEVASPIFESQGRRTTPQGNRAQTRSCGHREHDDLEQTAFFDKYGFGQPSSYWPVHEGRRHPSKAIPGAAAGFMPGQETLTASEFPGGIPKTLCVLKSLGFKMSSTLGHPTVGDRHENRRVIPALYGGNPQAGITRFPDGHPLLFSHYNSPKSLSKPSNCPVA